MPKVQQYKYCVKKNICEFDKNVEGRFIRHLFVDHVTSRQFIISMFSLKHFSSFSCLWFFYISLKNLILSRIFIYKLILIKKISYC